MLAESSNAEPQAAVSSPTDSTRINNLLRCYKNLLQKYQYLAVDYYRQDVEYKNTVNKLLKHAEMLSQENQRLTVENRLLNESNAEVALKLKKYTQDDKVAEHNQCLKVWNTRR